MTATTHQLLESGKSAELAAALQLVEEAEALGQRRFSRQVCHELGTLIVCRNYAPVLHELCHLVQIADQCGRYPDRVERFFWGAGPARPAVFRGVVEPHLPSDRISLTDNGVALDYGDGSFAVSFGRMPLLAAMMEFLVTTLGYLAVDDLVQGLREGDFSKAAVSAQSKSLAKQLYGYLATHLPSAQEQRKLHRLLGFMSRHRPEGFDLHAIDDDSILRFWREESLTDNNDGLDFRTYATVYRMFVDFHRVLGSLAESAGLDAPLPLGGDRDSGEVDPDRIQRQLEIIDRDRTSLGWLADSPADRIKFLNRKEHDDLQRLVEDGDTGRALALSLIRCEVFGKGQSRITQALRRKVDAQTLRSLTEQPAQADYADWLGQLRKHQAHLDKVLQASLHVLLRGESEQSLALLSELAGEMDLTPLRQLWPSAQADDDDKVVALGTAAIGKRLASMLSDPAVVGPELAGIATSAARAFKGLSRQGFRDEELDDAEVIAGYEQAGPLLIALKAQLAGFVATLEAHEPGNGWDGQFDRDRGVFSEHFQRLYLQGNRQEGASS